MAFVQQAMHAMGGTSTPALHSLTCAIIPYRPPPFSPCPAGRMPGLTPFANPSPFGMKPGAHPPVPHPPPPPYLPPPPPSYPSSPPPLPQPSGDNMAVPNPLASAYAPRPKAKKRDATHMLNPLPPPALSRPLAVSGGADAGSSSALPSAAAAASHRRPAEARPRVKLLPVKHSKLVGIEVPQSDLEKEAEDEARKVKEELQFEEEFVREKRTNRFEWVRKRLIGAKA
jgi:hypothetical protein